ncbi:MAG TPA: hypothetical protein VK835_09525 [Bacteroidia bacterium]|jgi:hypothetical protein|nr:hypothetical protein [Bacteroidia bacterium]
MKIACIGNMNNMFFQIGRYLIDEGHLVTFFLLEEFDHFLPQADTYEDISKYEIIKLGWNFDTFRGVTSQQIKKIFSSFDYLMGTDLAPAYLFKAGLKLDVYFPHGSDLYQYPFFRYKNNPPQLWEIPANIVSRAQFIGIKEADTVSLDMSDEVFETPYYKIRGKTQRRITSPPFLYFKQYTDNYPALSTYYKQFSEIRSQYKFIVFQQISQDWSMRGEFKIDKGNNNLINAFADYLNKNEKYKKDSLLILMEYGIDVEKSKQLIVKLGISNNVIWFKKMNRKDLMVAIYFSDICVGELGYRQWYSYSSIIEFMAMKKPLIHHRGDAFYKNKGLDLYPMVDADSAEKVADVFIDYRSNPKKYINMGADAHKWILADANKKVEFYKEILLKKKNTNQIVFPFLKKMKYYLNPQIIYNYLFLGMYQLKEMVRG